MKLSEPPKNLKEALILAAMWVFIPVIGFVGFFFLHVAWTLMVGWYSDDDGMLDRVGSAGGALAGISAVFAFSAVYLQSRQIKAQNEEAHIRRQDEYRREAEKFVQDMFQELADTAKNIPKGYGSAFQIVMTSSVKKEGGLLYLSRFKADLMKAMMPELASELSLNLSDVPIRDLLTGSYPLALKRLDSTRFELPNLEVMELLLSSDHRSHLAKARVICTHRLNRIRLAAAEELTATYKGLLLILDSQESSTPTLF